MKKPERTPDSEERTRPHDLTDICSEIFTLILQLRRTSDFGNFEILRQRVRGLLSRVEAKAREAGTSTEDIQLVLFACVAFLDETIIASDWGQKDEWLARPLQLEYFNRFDAGEEFSPQRVITVFTSCGVRFCASSTIRNWLGRERPRM